MSGAVLNYFLVIVAFGIGNNTVGKLDTWSAGRSHCSKHDGHLPFIKDKTDMQRLVSRMEARKLLTAWIGIKKTIYKGPQWHDGTNINPALSLLWNNSAECGLLSTSGVMFGQTCGMSQLGALCELNGCTKCPEEHHSSICFNHRRRCFLTFCGLKHWFEAQTVCEMYGSQLAKINDSTTMQTVIQNIKERNIKCTQYWIDVTSFSWKLMETTKTVITRYFWHPGEPQAGKTCAVISKINGVYGWMSDRCTNRNGVICTRGIYSWVVLNSFIRNEYSKYIYIEPIIISALLTTASIPSYNTTALPDPQLSISTWWIWMLLALIGLIILIVVVSIIIYRRVKKKHKLALTRSVKHQATRESAFEMQPMLSESPKTMRISSDILDTDRLDMLKKYYFDLVRSIQIDGTGILELMNTLQDQHNGQFQKLTDAIQNEKDTTKKNQMLLKSIKGKPNIYFDNFCQALKKTGQGYIVQQFLWNDNDFESCCHKIIKLYDQSFTDIMLYTSDKESDVKALHEIYVPMIWKRVSQEESTQNDIELNSPLDLFEQTGKDEVSRIVIEGEPGSGKTTFMKAVCREWIASTRNATTHAEENATHTERNTINSFAVVLAFLLRQVKADDTMENIITNQFSLLTCTELYALLNNTDQSPKKVCFFFDGLDELSYQSDDLKQKQHELLDVITNKQKHEALCITTTRSQGLTQLKRYHSKAIEAHVKLCGFNKEKVKEYISLYFKSHPVVISPMIEQIDNQNLWAVASVPIRLQMMCFVWKKYKQLGKNIAELYKMVILGLLDHMEKRGGIQLTQEKNILEKYKESVLLPIAKLANTWDKYGNLVVLFSFADIKEQSENNFENVLNFGIVTKYFPSSAMTDTYWNFTHLSLQEYFVAYSIACNAKSLEQFKNKCFNIRALERYKVILECLCVLDPDKSYEIVAEVFKHDHSELEYTSMIDYLLQLIPSYSIPLECINLPLPRTVIIDSDTETIVGTNVKCDYLSHLFNFDHEKHRNMNILKVRQLDEFPKDAKIGNVKGLYITVRSKGQLEKAKQLTSQLSDNANILDIVLFDLIVTDINELQIGTHNISVFSIKGPGVTVLASGIIREQPNLEALNIDETGEVPRRDQIQALCTEAKSRKNLRELNIHGYVLDNCLMSLASHIKLNMCSKFDDMKLFDSFSSQIAESQSNMAQLDLSFSKFSNQTESMVLGKLIAQILTNAKALTVLKLRKCGLTSKTVKQIEDELYSVQKPVPLEELDILGNQIDKCDELQGLLECCPELQVLLVTYAKESKGPRIAKRSTVMMATGTKYNQTVMQFSDSTFNLSKLFLVHARPDFSKIRNMNVAYQLKLLHMMDIPEADTSLLALAENLQCMNRLEELHFTRTEPQSLKEIENVLSLIRRLPPSLKHLNLYGYESPELIHILDEKYQLYFLQKLNVGSVQTDKHTLQVIRQELQLLNNEIDVYCYQYESFTSMLACSSNYRPNLFEGNTHIIQDAEALLQTLE